MLEKTSNIAKVLTLTIALSGPISDVMAGSKDRVQDLIDTTALGIKVVKGQSIDNGITIPNRKGNKSHHATKEELESLMHGPCDAYYSEVVNAKLSDSSKNITVFDIKGLEKTLKKELKDPNSSEFRNGSNVKIDGNLTQKEVDIMRKIHYSCG